MAEIEDQGILFKARKDEIAGKLADMKKAQIDVTTYEKEFKLIVEKAEAVQISEDDTFPGADKAFHTPVGIYTSVLQELDDLQKEIDKLDPYFKCSCSCDQIVSLMDSPSSDAAKEIDRVVEETLKNLKTILFPSQEPYMKETAVVEKVIATAYRVAKLELLQKGESSIIAYMQQNVQFVGLFENLIRKELEQGNLKYQAAIDRCIAQINENGIRSNLLSEELIILIILSTDPEIEKELNISFDVTLQEVSGLERHNNSYVEQYKKLKKKQKWVVPKLFGRGLLLAGTVLVMTHYATSIKNKTYPDAYISTYPTTYQEMYNGKVVADFVREETETGLSTAKIITYSPYQLDESPSRVIRTYTLPDTYLTYSLEELSKLDLSTLEYKSEPEQKAKLFPSDYYETDLVRIIRIYEDESQVTTEYDEKVANEALNLIKSMGTGLLIPELAFLALIPISRIKSRKQKKEVLEIILNAFRESEALEKRFCQRYPMYQSLFGKEKVEETMDDILRIKKKFETCL